MHLPGSGGPPAGHVKVASVAGVPTQGEQGAAGAVSGGPISIPNTVSRQCPHPGSSVSRKQSQLCCHHDPHPGTQPGEESSS